MIRDWRRAWGRGDFPFLHADQVGEGLHLVEDLLVLRDQLLQLFHVAGFLPHVAFGLGHGSVICEK